MAAKSTQSLMDFPESSRPMEAIGRSNSSNSLTGESSSASRVKVNGMFVGGVRGMSGAIKMERSEHERDKYPDRINLDRKGLHGGYFLTLATPEKKDIVLLDFKSLILENKVLCNAKNTLSKGKKL